MQHTTARGAAGAGPTPPTSEPGAAADRQPTTRSMQHDGAHAPAVTGVRGSAGDQARARPCRMGSPTVAGSNPAPSRAKRSTHCQVGRGDCQVGRGAHVHALHVRTVYMPCHMVHGARPGICRMVLVATLSLHDPPGAPLRSVIMIILMASRTEEAAAAPGARPRYMPA